MLVPLTETRPARGRPGRPGRSPIWLMQQCRVGGDGVVEGLGRGRGQGDTPRVMCYVEYRGNLVFQTNQFTAVVTDKPAY